MDKQQQRKADTQHPLTKRAPTSPNSVGGRFVAHGLKPATFAKLPGPIRTQKPIDSNLTEYRIRKAMAHGSATARSRMTEKQREEKRQRGFAKLTMNNARLATERPSGRGEDSLIDRTCQRCQRHFTSKHAFMDHAGPCGTQTAPPVAKECFICHQVFPTKRDWGRHFHFCFDFREEAD